MTSTAPPTGDDGNIVTLAKYARAGVEPEVGKVFLVGDGEQTPFRARVLKRSDDGLVVLRALDTRRTPFLPGRSAAALRRWAQRTRADSVPGH